MIDLVLQILLVIARYVWGLTDLDAVLPHCPCNLSFRVCLQMYLHLHIVV